ncbi:hypothetical protein GCM10028805_47340 [Spirosoma harenae]
MIFLDPVLFELPVLPRVQKFIRHKLTDASGQAHPLLASPEAIGPGQLIWAMAQADKKQLITGYERKASDTGAAGDRGPCKRLHFEKKLTAEIGVGIREYHYRRHQYLLNYIELEIFSNVMDYLIYNEAVQFCQARTDMPPMTRIKAFCDQYDFSPTDISEDAIKQMYLRYRKGKAASSFSAIVHAQYQFIPVAA